MKMTAAQIMDSEIRIVDRAPLQIADMAVGIEDLAGIGFGGGRTIPGAGTGGASGGGKVTGPVFVIPGAGDDGEDAVAVDRMLDAVRPGDLITSDFMMRLLARVNRLEAAVGNLAARGDVRVPDLFGRLLADVVEALERSGGLLRVGPLLDTAGQQVDPKQPGRRVVLGQHPAPGEEVDKGTKMNLLVSFVLGGERQPVPGGGTGGGSGGTGGGSIGNIGNIGIGEIDIVDGTRIVGGGTNVPVVTDTTPPVTGRTPPRPTPDDLGITLGRTDVTLQPGAVTGRPEVTTQPAPVAGPSQPDPVAGARPAGGLERVTDDFIQPAAGGGVTQPGVTVGGTGSVAVGDRPGGTTNVAVGGVTEAVAGRLTDATVGGTSNVDLNPAVGGAVGGANIRSEEAPMSEEAPRDEEAPKFASKGATKSRKSPKK